MSTVKVKEWVSGPGQYVEKSYTFAELRETFSEGDLVWSLLDEVERLRALIKRARPYVQAYAAITRTDEVSLDASETAEAMRLSGPTSAGPGV